MRKVTEVAIGILLDKTGRFLMASRPEGKPYAGWWEFPGGKLEAGETVLQALAREYAEELAVAVREATPWFVFEREYPHAHVRLHCCRITDWEGEPRPQEGQVYRWFDGLQQAQQERLLPMCDLVIRRLGLSERAARVRDANAPGTTERFIRSGARVLLADEPNEDRMRLARALGVELIVCREAMRTTEETENPALQDELIGVLAPEANVRGILTAARQRVPLYVPAGNDPDQDKEMLRLGAQGVYVDIG